MYQPGVQGASGGAGGDGGKGGNDGGIDGGTEGEGCKGGDEGGDGGGGSGGGCDGGAGLLEPSHQHKLMRLNSCVYAPPRSKQAKALLLPSTFSVCRSTTQSPVTGSMPVRWNLLPAT